MAPYKIWIFNTSLRILVVNMYFYGERNQDMPLQTTSLGMKIILSWRQLQNSKHKRSCLSSSYLKAGYKFPFLKRFDLFMFRDRAEGGRKRRRETLWERNMDRRALPTTPTRTQPAAQAGALTQNSAANPHPAGPGPPNRATPVKHKFPFVKLSHSVSHTKNYSNHWTLQWLVSA